MLTENFSSIELGDAAAYAPYFRALPLHAADYTFTNLWGWGTHYNLEWRTAHGLCWIRQKRNDLPVERLWAPVGDWYATDWAAMPELVPGTTILRAPEPLCELLLERLPGRVAIEETPGQWEYLYTQEALSTLAGNKLHKKKNHVNGYMKAYGEDYRALNGEIMPQVLALQDDWCKWRECEVDVIGVHVRERLEEHALAFHDRLAREGADVAEPEDGGAVGNDGHEVAAPGVGIGEGRIVGDGEAGVGDAGGIGHRQVFLGEAGFDGKDFKLSRAGFLMVGEGLFLGEQRHDDLLWFGFK